MTGTQCYFPNVNFHPGIPVSNMFMYKISLLFALIAHFSTEKESCIRVGLAQPEAGMNTDRCMFKSVRTNEERKLSLTFCSDLMNKPPIFERGPHLLNRLLSNIKTHFKFLLRGLHMTLNP